VVVNPTPKVSELTVNSGEAGAAVFINGQQRGVTNQNGILRIPSLTPGQHIIMVRKQGYHDYQSNVELIPGRSQVIEARLKPVPRRRTVEETLSQAESAYRAQLYDDVIVNCTEVLRTQPDNLRANALIGQSYFMKGDSQSIEYLVKVIKAGETVTLPIKHHHRVLGTQDAFCSGTLTFRKDTFEFRSNDRSGEGVTALYNKILELKPEGYKGGRVNTKIGIPKGTKEEKKDYNFHVPIAYITSQAGYADARCDNCDGMVQSLYLLFQKLKQ
jgi:hypothetical protein